MLPILYNMTRSVVLLYTLLALLRQGTAAPVRPAHSDTLALPCRQKAEQLLDEALRFHGEKLLSPGPG